MKPDGNNVEGSEVPKNIVKKKPKKTAILFILLILIIFDVLFAQFFKLISQHKENDEKKYRVKSDIYHHGLSPLKSVYRAQWGQILYTVHTNSLGFKDKAPIEVELSTDDYRLIFIGDSFTEGIGLSYEKTFVGLIDQELTKFNIEVLNSAVVSYSPIIYFTKIKHFIEDIDLRFDELVVFIDISDIQDDAINYALDENNSVVLNHALISQEKNEAIIWFQSMKNFLKNNSLIFKSIALFKNPIKKSYPLNQRRSLWTIREDIYEDWGKLGLKKSRHYMNKLHSLLDKYGIRLTIAVYPWPDQIFYNDEDSIQVRFWRGWAAERNVDFINYFAVFMTGEKYDILDKYYLVGDGHWNEAGHRRVAEHFLQYYKTR
ncbi:SGNH/GDSL hydrolase family protein [Acidobacteriota bacterium]